jgi:NADPH:quinone reductase
LIEISATGQREVTFDLADFDHNEGQIFGVDISKLDLIAAADVLEALRPGFEDGSHQPAPSPEYSRWSTQPPPF